VSTPRLTPVSRVAPDGHDRRELTEGWQFTSTSPGEGMDARALDGFAWSPARIPGTAAGALREAGLWRAGDGRDFDACDWWFRTRVDGERAGDQEEVVLALDGVATVAEVYLNGERVLDSHSMFAAHEIDVGGALRGENELAICCRALGPLLNVPRGPRARWRTRLVADGNLRFFRTMLLGRAPGFAPGPAVVGPWRPVWLERRRGIVVDELELRSTVQPARRGVLAVRARVRALAPDEPVRKITVVLSGPTGVHRAELSLHAGAGGTEAIGTMTVPDVELWWPHTHGSPTLYAVTLLARIGATEIAVDAGRVGFRRLEAGKDLERDGVKLCINGVPTFARGAVWTPLDLAAPHSTVGALRRVLGAVIDGGMNMLRVPGIACYESEDFYDLCDELGILLWQDFMFANLDYPERDPAFMDSVQREARQVLGALGRRPSLAVLCGGSEVAQQVAMLGLDPQLANGPLYGDVLPALVAGADIEAPYLPSTPWGGDLPFRPNRGVAHYYGVGAYRRPLEDVRRSEVRFAAECLAFSNVPDEEALESFDAFGGPVAHHPAWKAGVPRDTGAGWDFEDVRDHYLKLLFQLDPVELRSIDPDRYLELSRFTTGEVMAEVFGEWRREASPCSGGLVLWLSDLQAGAGWGVLDHRGSPKTAYHHLRRALAPIAVWSTDEGLGGVVAHIANDSPGSLQANLRVALYRDFELLVGETQLAVELEAHSGCEHNVEQLLGWFVDASWSYRFGPPAQDLIVLSLEGGEAEGRRLLSQSLRFPASRPRGAEPAARLELSATVHGIAADTAVLSLSAKRFVYGVRVRVPGFVPDDDGFSLEPGHRRDISLRRVAPGAEPVGSVTALNLVGRVSVRPEAGAA
jgi:beta-mannosidase